MMTIKPLDMVVGSLLGEISEDEFGASIISVAGSGSGTGWFCENKTLVTASHVVGINGRATAYFKGKALSSEATYPSSSRPVPSSNQDIATLTISEGTNRPLSIGILENESAQISIVGRLDGKLYRSFGGAYKAGEGILLFNASADDGMSGSPIFWNGTVIAIHLGSVAKTSLAGKPTFKGFVNAGLLFTEQVNRFLLGG